MTLVTNVRTVYRCDMSSHGHLKNDRQKAMTSSRFVVKQVDTSSLP